MNTDQLHPLPDSVTLSWICQLRGLRARGFYRARAVGRPLRTRAAL